MAGNVVIPNLRSSFSNQDTFYGIWSLTRAMKSAGWIYKASGNGTTKETTGNAILDTWGPGILVQSTQLSSQTGAAATIGTISVTTVTINGLTGMTANSVGHGLLISGAVNSTNNGTFTIIAFNSATSVNIWNPYAVAEGTSLTWSERVSGTGASISASTGDEAVLSGLSGLSTTTSPGHMITVTNATNSSNNGTFRISAVLTATSCKIKNSAAIMETGTLVWVENNPVGDLYPYTQFVSPTSWINMQGPSTMRIPISGASTGNFVRGENLTQTSSGAQGELVGYLWDIPTSQGYLVVMPRISGTGSGPRGWTSGISDTVTGAISAATAPTFSVPVDFVREIVFWKSSNVQQGWIAYQCVDQNVSTEGTNRFSYLAANAAGVTASVAPAGGGTANAFPSLGTMICIGATTATYTNWDVQSTTPTLYGRIQILTANSAGTSGTSADGSFSMVVGRPDQNSNYCSGFIFSRVDNSEDGDVDPYVWYQGNGGGNYGGSRTSCVAGGNVDTWSFIDANSNSTQIRGWRRRGFNLTGNTNGDAFQQFSATNVTATVQNGNNSIIALNYNSQDNDSIACSFSPTKVRDAIFVVSGQIGSKMRKGSMRWMYAVAGGNAMDTFDSKKWLQCSGNVGGNTGTGPFLVGPWDGVSVPIQT